MGAGAAAVAFAGCVVAGTAGAALRRRAGEVAPTAAFTGPEGGRLRWFLRGVALCIVYAPLLPLRTFHGMTDPEHFVQQLRRSLWQKGPAAILDLWMLLQ